MQLIKPINNFNITSFILFKSLFISLELCFLVYSIKMNIFSFYNYLIFSIVANLLTNILNISKFSSYRNIQIILPGGDRTHDVL